MEARSTEQDEYGQPLDLWLPVATVAATVEPLQGRECLAASMVVSAIDALITLLYRPGVSCAMRVIHGTDTQHFISDSR